MVKVSYKNSFLCVEESEASSEDDETACKPRDRRMSPRQAASPRSRSVDAPSPSRVPEDAKGREQIFKLNVLANESSPLASPARSRLGSFANMGGTVSPPLSGYMSPVAQELLQPLPPARGEAASSNRPASPGLCGPSEQDLKLLHQRIAQGLAQQQQQDRAAQDRAAQDKGASRQASLRSPYGSVSTMAPEPNSEDSEEGPGRSSKSPPANVDPPAMQKAWSSNSVSSMVSYRSASPADYFQSEADGGELEIEMTIEEGPAEASGTSWKSTTFESQPSRPKPSRRAYGMPLMEDSVGSSASPARGRFGSDASYASGQGSNDASPRTLGMPGGCWTQDPRNQVPSQPGFRPAPRRQQQGQQGPASCSPGSASPKSGASSPKMPSGASSPGPYVAPGGRHQGRSAQGGRRPLPKEYRHGHVPKTANLEQKYRNAEEQQAPTTLMIRNIPNRYTQRELILELEDMGFNGTFDFLYIPLDKGTMSNVGYAFVNFVEPEMAAACMKAFQNYRFKRHRKISGKIAAVSVAHIQGLDANLAHYENSAVNTAKLKQRRPVIVANISQKIGSLAAALGIDDDE